MPNSHSRQIPVKEVKGPIQRFDFTNGGDGSLIIQSQVGGILVFGIREESFGHELVRFVPIEQGHEFPADDKTNLFYAYADKFLSFYDEGRFISFVSAIGGVGILSPSERKFGIMYPIIVLDLLEKQFAFAEMDSSSTLNKNSEIQSIKKSMFEWYSGLKPAEVLSKFREINPQVAVSTSQPEPLSLFKKVIRFFKAD